MRWTFLSLLVMTLLTTTGCSTTSSNKSLVYLVKVEQGDSLSRIATKYDTSWLKIARMNKIDKQHTLKVGQILRISPGQGGIVADAKYVGSPNNSKLSSSVGRRGLLYGGKKTAAIDWPVNGRITSKYGRRWGRMHHGVDISSPVGHRVHSAKDGVVTFVGYKRGYGKTIIIKHENRKTLYAHLSKILVNHGDKVTTGHSIGKIGMTGNSRGPHLHFEIRDLKGRSIDPLKYLPEDKMLASSHH